MANKLTLLPRTFVNLSMMGLAGLCMTGCGKKPEATSQATATNQAPAETQQPAAAEVQTAQAQPATPPPMVNDPAELNRELRKWIVRNRRPPKSFEDFAATAGISIPPPPDGKRYAIDKTMHVVLVKR